MKTFTQLGEIVLNATGEAACQSGYGTTDPHEVGELALRCGDINADGTLN